MSHGERQLPASAPPRPRPALAALQARGAWREPSRRSRLGAVAGRGWCCSACSSLCAGKSPARGLRADVHAARFGTWFSLAEHAAARGAADADGAVHRAAGAARAGRHRRRRRAGAGRPRRRGGRRCSMLGAPPVPAMLLHGAGGDARRRRCGSARRRAARTTAASTKPSRSLLLTYIAIALINHLVEGPLRDPASLNKPSTAADRRSATCSATLPGHRRALGPRRRHRGLHRHAGC